jgi:mono/diheme cytochrome c family protein
MKMMTKTALPIVLGLLPLASLAAPADLDRGRLLYENHCRTCHESGVHIREVQAARSFPALRAQVVHWQDVLKLEWSPEDVGDVAGYLNATWYHHAE